MIKTPEQRKTDIEKLANPEQLDQLMQVVALRDWIPLASLGAVVGSILIWSIVGALPVNVSGRGAFIYPQTQAGTAEVAQFQAPGAGRLIDLRVVRGDHVSKGTLIGIIDQPDTRKNLEIAREKRDELSQQQVSSDGLQQQLDRDQLKSLNDQHASLLRKIADAEAIQSKSSVEAARALENDQRNFQHRLHDAVLVRANQLRNYNAQKKLKSLGLISDQVYSDAERAFLDSDHTVSDLQTQLLQQGTKRLDARKTADNNRSQIVDLRAQLVDMEGKINNQHLTRQQQEATDTNALADANRQVDQLEHELRNNSFIVSDYDGTILEVAAITGQMVTTGTNLGAIQVSNTDEASGEGKMAALQSVAYFTVGDGKRIKPGMTIQITPDTVKREEYGGIVGKVTNVSAFPVTAQGAMNMLNSTDLANDITSGGHTIEVVAQLEQDPSTFSGYKWSSSAGPQLKLTAGTTSVMRVTVEQQTPISMVLPILRQFSGIY